MTVQYDPVNEQYQSGRENCGWSIITVNVHIIMIIQEMKYHTYKHIFQLDKKFTDKYSLQILKIKLSKFWLNKTTKLIDDKVNEIKFLKR